MFVGRLLNRGDELERLREITRTRFLAAIKQARSKPQ
jgi:hypothetical protein